MGLGLGLGVHVSLLPLVTSLCRRKVFLICAPMVYLGALCMFSPGPAFEAGYEDFCDR